MKKKYFKYYLLFNLIMIIILTPFFVYSNTHIDVESITIASKNLPAAFDGAKIVQISDYHNHGGRNDKTILNKIKEVQPDFIVITGDTVDRVLTDIDTASSFIGEVVKLAPCYMVWGNHEMGLDQQEFQTLKANAESYGITILNGETLEISKGEDHILLTGNVVYPTVIMNNREEKEHEYSIWLNHFPENFEEIVDVTKGNGNHVDLVFSGHAHGGLVRLPFTDGLIAPGQGFLPQYASGVYEYNGSKLVVSRGLGNSFITVRLFDPFHLIICTLEKED